MARISALAQRGWRLLSSLGVVICVAALAGCATRGGPVPYNVQNFNAPDAPIPVAGIGDYHLGPSDVLTVSVYGVPEFSGDYTVDNLGRIQLPLVGEVTVQGQTSDQVSTAVQTKLRGTYLRDPQVQVLIKATLSQRITVEGSVTQPGIYAIGSATSLLQSIALARGETSDSNPRRVVVFRMINGRRNAAAFDLKDIRGGKQPDPQVYGDDVIVVDGNEASTQFKNAISLLPLITLFRPF